MVPSPAPQALEEAVEALFFSFFLMEKNFNDKSWALFN